MGDAFGNWFLVNASPDLPFHLRTYLALAPRSDSSRNSPISAIFLTNADVDHVLGLFSLREGGRVHIHTTPAIEQAAAMLGVNTILQAFSGVEWHHPELAGDFTPLLGSNGTKSSLSVRVLPLWDHAPRYLGKKVDDGVYTVALQFLDAQTGSKLLVAPGVPEWRPALEAAAKDSQAVLVDGTFWSEDELQRVRPGAATASEMGHLPIKDGTLPLLSALNSRYRVYVHINNTNPILAPKSKERATVEAAGIVVGQDGMTFDL